MIRPHAVFLAILALIAFLVAGCTPGTPPYPPTEKIPVTEEYHGMKVTDDYRWLEDQTSPGVNAWVDSQNTFTRSVLDGIPARARIMERLTRLYKNNSICYREIRYQGKLFALKSQPSKQHACLVTLDSPADLSTEKSVFDPDIFDSAGAAAIDFYVPSHNGRLVAVSVSAGGSEDGSVYIVEAATGRILSDRVPRVNSSTAGGSVAWNREGTGFYYTRDPQGEERPTADRHFYQQVYFHTLGTPAGKDRYVIGKDFPRTAKIRLETSPDGEYLFVSVANGDGGECAHFLRSPAGSWTQITQGSDNVKNARMGHDGRIYLISFHDAPRGEVLVISPKEAVLGKAKVLVPQSNVVITNVQTTASRIYVTDILGGPAQVRVFDLKGNFQYLLPTPPVANVVTLIGLPGGKVLYGTETYLEPLAYFRHDPVANGTSRLPLSSVPTVRFDDCEIVRDSATSADGTRVPMTILRKKGTPMDGNAPAILYGYGGYGVSEVPAFFVRHRLWLDAGGIYVTANLRGGGEFGQEWYRAGKLTRKQNVFDDFIACAHHISERKYTNPHRLAIEGWGNGGLLMGAVMTQRPELFCAVVSHAGIYDMLRAEVFPKGAFTVTEFGTVRDPDQFRALYAYSPYHHVKNGIRYPAVIMLTGDNNGRVDPANSCKMVARLQAASSSPKPILLRPSADADLGMGTALPDKILQETDVFTFLFEQLHLPSDEAKE